MKGKRESMYKIKAFTLAEVLITIGIIGLVAALTFPSIIGYYQKKVLKEQFKVAYSMFSQLLLKSEVDLGGKADMMTEVHVQDMN